MLPQHGLEKFNGCPDTDEDEIPDHEDACPYIVGLPDLNGCPDSDGDGVIDSLDECPDLAGKSSNKGCPEPTDEIIKKLNDLAKRFILKQIAVNYHHLQNLKLINCLCF